MAWKKKGYILKSEFCKKYGVKYKDFTKKFVDAGYLEEKLISECLLTGKKKYAYSIVDHGDYIIHKYSGSWSQPPYQYHERRTIDLWKND